MTTVTPTPSLAVYFFLCSSSLYKPYTICQYSNGSDGHLFFTHLSVPYTKLQYEADYCRKKHLKNYLLKNITVHYKILASTSFYSLWYYNYDNDCVYDIMTVNDIMIVDDLLVRE